MEIILSKQCEALTGSLGKGFGYHIQRRTDHDGKTRFWGVRQSIGVIPHGGYLRFIFACADLAQMKTHITDIRLPRKEFSDALWEAGEVHLSFLVLGDDDLPELLDAQQVIEFKNAHSL